MNAILVDSNIIIDILSRDVRWRKWSEERLVECAERAELAINPIIYAEVSLALKSIEETEAVLGSDNFQYLPIPKEAGFLAGKLFLRYRRQGGKKNPSAPRFLHWRPCCCIGNTVADKRRQALSHILSKAAAYFP